MKIAKERADSELDEFVESQAEGEEDLSESKLGQLNQAVVTSTDWTTETILNQIDRGNIILNPKFQRRDAWRAPRKSRFIESLILGLPIPQLVLAENKSRKGTYIVIDGKQRLLTLRQFAANGTDKDYRQLTLEGLEVLKHLNGATLEDFQKKSRFERELTAFQNQPIRTVVIKGWPNEDVLYLIFLRLNTGNVQLSPQELRQALHPGAFVEFANEKSGEMGSLQEVLGLSEPDFRMRDVELMVRYYAFRNHISDYSGNLKGFLDSTCQTLNVEWKARQSVIEGQAIDLDEAIKGTFRIFGERNAFRKWDGKKFERRFNRAIFDVMVYYFADSRIRKAAFQHRDQLVAAFKKLCTREVDFLRSIETTTKSLEATSTRFYQWGKVLRRQTRLSFLIPKLQGDRIILSR